MISTLLSIDWICGRSRTVIGKSIKSENRKDVAILGVLHWEKQNAYQILTRLRSRFASLMLNNSSLYPIRAWIFLSVGYCWIYGGEEKRNRAIGVSRRCRLKKIYITKSLSRLWSHCSAGKIFYLFYENRDVGLMVYDRWTVIFFRKLAFKSLYLFLSDTLKICILKYSGPVSRIRSSFLSWPGRPM